MQRERERERRQKWQHKGHVEDGSKKCWKCSEFDLEKKTAFATYFTQSIKAENKVTERRKKEENQV